MTTTTSTKTTKPGGTLTLSRESTDNPKLCAKKLSDGRLSLYLNYYLGYRKETDPLSGKETVKVIRRKESLNLYLFDNPRAPEQRQHNREVNELAKQIRFEREQARREACTGYRIPRRKNGADFLQYYREYIDNYDKKDADILRISYSRFTDFLRDTPKYTAFCLGIRPAQITRDMVVAFTLYLRSRSRGGGARTIYSHFKKVVKYATEHDFFTKNPCIGISIKADSNVLTKEILSVEEIMRLMDTPFEGNPDIRRAFLFSLYTGVRFCDVKEMTFGQVDFSNRILKFTQSKTMGHSAHAVVTIPLNDNTLSLIGEKGGRDEKIFPLPTFVTCSAHIRKWVDNAGIDKHITWHCARHSFAVNILNNGANIKTVSSLLGHSSISMTEKYLHAVDALKRQAVDSLPALVL